MLFLQGKSNEKSIYDKWGQKKIPKISWLKDILYFIIQNILKNIIDIIQSLKENSNRYL